MGLNLENNKPAQKPVVTVAKQKAATVSNAASAGSPGGPAVNKNGTLSTTKSASGTPNVSGSPASNAAAPVPANAAAPTPVINPYLTPAQIASYTSAYNGYQNTIGGAAGQRGTLTDTFNQNSAKNAVGAQNSFNNTNQSDAARGFGFSGVHDNAMSDIQANAVMNQNNYNTAYGNGLATVAANVTNAQTGEGNLNAEYSGIAGENAMTDAAAEGGTVGSTPYNPTAPAAPAQAPTISTPAPTTYFNNPNMGAINSAIGAGAAKGTAAGA
jgi:hypothetical protein